MLRSRQAACARGGLLLALGPAAALVWFRALRPGPAQCEISAVVAVSAAVPSKGGASPRWWWWRVLCRLAALFCRAAPVVCAAPLCLAFWRWGGERFLWRLLLCMLQAHGPVAIKCAQWASTRPDLLPKRLCSHLAELQARVRPHSYHETCQVLEEAFGSDWGETLSLEREPVGSGCMAQVYRGQLLCSAGPGQPVEIREVAVKVRHPGAQEHVELDLEVMRTMVWAIETACPSARYLAMSEALEHFSDFVRPQADLRVEAANMEMFAKNFEYSRTGKGMRVVVPKVIHSHVTEAVLAQSFESGASVQALLEMDGGSCGSSDTAATLVCLGGSSVAEVRGRVGQLCMDAFLKMVFVDNFIHGDMHPGNILFRVPDTGEARLSETEVVLLDAGLAVKMQPRDRQNFVELFYALVTDNGHLAGQLMVERSPGDRSLVLDEAVFLASVARLVGLLRSGLSLGKLHIGDLFGQMLALACHHRVKLETSFVKVATSIIVVEGVGQQLNPFTDLIGAARPLLVEAVRQRLW